MRQVMRPKTTVYESCDRYGNKRTSKRLAKFAKGQESEKGAVKRLPFHCLDGDEDFPSGMRARLALHYYFDILIELG